jgi:hypothetical protein
MHLHTAPSTGGEKHRREPRAPRDEDGGSLFGPWKGRSSERTDEIDAPTTALGGKKGGARSHDLDEQRKLAIGQVHYAEGPPQKRLYRVDDADRDEVTRFRLGKGVGPFENKKMTGG